MPSDNYENLLGRCIDCLKSSKELDAKYLDGDAQQTIKNLAKEYCEANFEIEKSNRAMEKLRTVLSNTDDHNSDIDGLYKQYMNEDETELVYMDSEIWKEIFSIDDITEVKQKSKKLADASYDKLDDSLMCSNVFEPPLDPISKTIIQEPFKNKFCGHVYEYDVVISYIQEKKNKARCPYVGCTNAIFRASDLRPDHKLKDLVKKYMENRKDSESSEEE